MADPLLAYDDLELFLVRWWQAALDARPEPVTDGVVVDRVEPSGPSDLWPAKLVVIRHDGTSDTSFTTGEASVGASTLAGTKMRPDDAIDLARIVHALASQIPSPDPANPVAALLERNGPYLVAEAQPRARAYSNFTFSVVPRPL